MIKKIEKMKIQRRVVPAMNGIQFHVEELIMTNKIGIWKIAKFRYSYKSAKEEMEILDGTH